MLLQAISSLLMKTNTSKKLEKYIRSP